MDVQLYLRVLWRFRYLVALGCLLAALLTILSVAKPHFDHGVKLTYRQQEKYSSTTTILVTQKGFPLGRSVYDTYLRSGTSGATPGTPLYSDPFRFSSLASLYTALVTSDAVKQILSRSGPLNGTIVAAQPSVPGNTGLLPYVQITGTATSPTAAARIADRGRNALNAYVRAQQEANQIPPNKRVILEVLNKAEPAQLTVKRSLTRPIVVLLATLMAVIGLAFLLENLRPRVRKVEHEASELAAASASRRTA